MSRRIEISSVAYQQFWQSLSKRLPKTTQIMAVVKANGYGLGAVTMARVALASGCVNYLGVATVSEGVQLREAGIHTPILVFCEPNSSDIPLLLTYDLEQTVYSGAFVSVLQTEAKLAKKQVRVHLKVDTGMGRLGCLPSEFSQRLMQISSFSGLELVGVSTHFACADEPENLYTSKQLALFLSLTKSLPKSIVRHCANSAATAYFPETHLDMVRIGIDSYVPSVTLKSRVQLVKPLFAGQGVSYGQTYIATQDTHVAVVEMGYADGVPRCFSGSVLIRGQKFPVIGRVCMDVLAVEVAHAPVSAGDEVVLIGQQEGSCLEMADFCQASGKISYEVLCGLGPRVSRLLV